MNKYLKMVLHVTAYLLVIFALNMLYGRGLMYSLVYRSLSAKEFLESNVLIFIFFPFMLCVMAYYFILKFKGESLLEKCNFRALGRKEIFTVTTMGFFMSVFAVSLAGLSIIDKNFPGFKNYLNIFFNGTAPVFITVILLAAVPAMEEILFRATIYNEMRKALPVAAAVVLQAAVYAVLQFDLMVGFISFTAAILYAVTYTRTGTLSASVLLDSINAILIFIFIRTGLVQKLYESGDALLLTVLFVSVAGIAASLYVLSGNKGAVKASGVVIK